MPKTCNKEYPCPGWKQSYDSLRAIIRASLWGYHGDFVYCPWCEELIEYEAWGRKRISDR